MNKKAIATDAIAIIAVLFFTIIITTGTLFWLNFEDAKKQLMEIESETINQGIILKNYLRTPITDEINIAEFIVQSIGKQDNKKLIEQSTQNIKPFFWELQIFNGNKKILTIKGDQNKPSKNEKILQEQEIPNYFGEDTKYYLIRMIGKKIDTDLIMPR